MPTKLHIFDFDKTTFKSPEKPDWWTKGWWGRDESLGPPCVPDKPGPDWWNGAVVSKAKRSISDADVHAVLVTGRVGKFKQRINTLLRQAGLNFNEVFLSSGKSTEAYKLATFKDLLAKHPDVTEVEIWEDRAPHLGTFKKFFESVGLKCKPHLIKIEPHDVECSPDTKLAHKVVARWLAAAAQDKIPGGLADKRDPKDFDSSQLAKGKKVEMEHTDDPKLAQEIAMDHLTEDPAYYTKLEKIERHARRTKS